MYCGIVEKVSHKIVILSTQKTKNGCGIGPASGDAGRMTHLFRYKCLDVI